jgi:hypothetical protein
MLFNASSGDIWCNGGHIIASSDERIKKNITKIDNSLDVIMKIKPCKFNYIDEVNNGTANVYGFISQEVEEIIPEAVSPQKEYIPNIYCLGFCLNNIITLSSRISPVSPDIIKVGSNIKIIDYNGKEILCQITKIIGPDIFTVNSNFTTSKLFVYGTEINDLKTLDKDTIFSYNVSATQELSRKIDALTSRIQYLENFISSNI